MKTAAVYLFTFVGLLLLSCGSQKQAADPTKLGKLEEMVNERAFQIDVDWADPLGTRSMNALVNSGLFLPGSSANRINIIGTVAYLKVQNDSVFARLPYFGERQFAGGYNTTDAGINFEGVPEDFEIIYNEAKQEYDFKFDMVNALGEAFNINGTLFSNLKGYFYINSNQRLSIGYSGFLATLE